jgi:hypothetical protein
MAKQQRMMRVEQRGQMAAMQQLESKTDEELEAETKYKAAAQAILGYRAAERYDAKAARAHFQRALAAARPTHLWRSPSAGPMTSSARQSASA